MSKVKINNRAFNYIKPPYSLSNRNSSYKGSGYWYSESPQIGQTTHSLEVGAGSTAFKVDPQVGLWLGGNKFSQARTRIDMNGNYVYKDSEGIDRILIGEN